MQLFFGYFLGFFMLFLIFFFFFKDLIWEDVWVLSEADEAGKVSF